MTEAVKGRHRRPRPEDNPAGDGAKPRDGPELEVPSLTELSQPDWEAQRFPEDLEPLGDIGGAQQLGKGSTLVAKVQPECQDDVWNMALVPVCTSSGQPVELLTIVDGYTQECLAIMADGQIALENIVDRLFDLFVLREVPRHIMLSNSRHPVSDALAEWLKRLPVETRVSGSEGRWDDGGPGSFGARLRDELVSGRTFTTLTEVSEVTSRWRRQYNETRPQHSPLEDEPQAPQGDGGSGCLEADPALGQTLPPPEGSTVEAPEKSLAPPGWDAKIPRWAAYAARAVELVGIVVVFLMLTLVVMAMLAPHFGWRADTVLSGSMEPALPVGSIEVTRPVNTADIQVDDIITFRSPTNGELMSHRVVEVVDGETPGFRTKGDKNEDVDPYTIPPENVVGRYYTKVDHAGYVVERLKSPLGFILLGLFGLALIGAEISTMLEVRWREAARADTKAK